MSNVNFNARYTREDYLEKVQQDFTRRASSYNANFSGEHHRALIKSLLTRYPAQYPVLDIACGTGLLASALGQNGRGVTGVDVTAAMLGRARELAPEGAFLDGRAEALPVDDAAFGSAYICAALVYFTDIPGAVREAFRVLRPGGFLAYQAVTLRSYVMGVLVRQALVEVLGVRKADEVFRLPHDVTDGRVENEELMRAAGFVDVEMGKEVYSMEARELDGEKFEELWKNNAFFVPFSRLGEEERGRVMERYRELFEERRKEGVVEEVIESWYVRGWKGQGDAVKGRT